MTRESPYTRRSPWTSVLIDTNAVSKKEKIKQTIRRKRRAEWSGFGGAPTGCKEFGSLPRRFLVSRSFRPYLWHERTNDDERLWSITIQMIDENIFGQKSKQEGVLLNK